MNDNNKLNNLISFFNKHKYHVFTGVALLIVIIIASTMVSIIIERSGEKQDPGGAPSLSPVSSGFPTPSINQEVRIVTARSPEAAIIQTEVKPYLDTIITIPYAITGTKTYGTDWAILQVSSQSTDPAMVVVHKMNSSWKVVLGPGTFFNEDALKSVGVPPDLTNDLYKPF